MTKINSSKSQGLVLLNQNLKLSKGNKLGISTFGLELMPHKMYDGKTNLCPNENGCASGCIVNSGNSRFDAVMDKRRYRTKLFLEQKEVFLSWLYREIQWLEMTYKTVHLRLNVFSDLPWENIKYQGKNMFDHFPNIQGYDYTKSASRVMLNTIPNYHLTFSGDTTNWATCQKLLSLGKNVALVFKNVPTVYNGFKVISGDETDNRALDEKGVIVGLKWKNATGKGANNKKILEESKLIIL